MKKQLTFHENGGLMETNLPLRLISRGKVRDIYEIGTDHLLMIATDRLSAFDVVLPTPIPGKGEILTHLSTFWMDKMEWLIPNHLTDIMLHDIEGLSPEIIAQLGDRALIVKRLTPLPVEAIVRGYLIGSGWKDYRATGAVCGITLPTDLRQANKLPELIFTPSTKANEGAHDENVSFKRMVELFGGDRPLADHVRNVSIRMYAEAAHYALKRGIIIADTKFEFGRDERGVMHLIDEVLTPDSSRFWPEDTYRVDTSPPSFDKQFVRDHLETLDWDKKAPGPELPENIAIATAIRYQEAEARLTKMRA